MTNLDEHRNEKAPVKAPPQAEQAGLAEKPAEAFVVSTRVVAARRRPPVLAVAIAIAVTSLVVVGGLDRFAPGPADDTPEGPRASAPAAIAEPTRAPRSARTSRPFQPTAPPEVLDIDLRPAGSNLFVHGDVFSLAVAVVVVSLEDPSGKVAESRAVWIQGGSTALRIGANARFDVRFAVADEVMGEGLWVRADAYDRSGEPLAKVRRPVPAPRSLFGLGLP